MKKTFDKNKQHDGYQIGEHILVHCNINDPESWYVTIRPLQIFGVSLCKKTCTELETLNNVRIMLNKKHDVITELLDNTLESHLKLIPTCK